MEVSGSQKSSILIVTGERGSGKSFYCRKRVEDARRDGLKVAGLLSVALFSQGEKVGIEIEDLSSGERQLLASISPDPSRRIRLGPWHFDERAIEWANQVLELALPCDLLVVDEIGILEFDQANGFLAAFDILDHGVYRLALVVVRPEYLEKALARWSWAEKVWIK